MTVFRPRQMPLRLAAVVGVMVSLFVACGGTGGGTEVPATIQARPITTTLPPQAVVAPRTAPAPKPTTSVTTTTILPKPAGFPASLQLPAGEVGYYTGSPGLGFHLNLSTQEKFIDLVRFFTAAIDESGEWTMSVRDVGRGFLPGFEDEWAIYTADDHVLTQLEGERYQGVIELEGRHVNILLDPIVQPPSGEEPAALPSREELPRPDSTIESVQYSAGFVRMVYSGGPDDFGALLESYRELGWNELGVADLIAVGELAGWRITLELREAGGLALDFENLAMSYP